MSAATWLPDVLSEAFRGVKGYQVDTVSGWERRSAKTTSFEPIGVMNHHTGPGSYANLLSFMTQGSSIAPLCHVATSRPHDIGGISTVRITVCAAGRANHAGKGHLTWTGADGGNRCTIGIENQNDGRQAWPQQQVEGIRIATAAILRKLRRSTDFMVDHKTYAPGRKPDRHSVDLAVERAEVKRLLDQGSTSTSTSTTGGQAGGGSGSRTHTVKAGDNLFRIGQAFGVDWREIARLNGIKDETTLKIGTVLKIP
jgi:LysM repeat protein